MGRGRRTARAAAVIAAALWAGGAQAEPPALKDAALEKIGEFRVAAGLSLGGAPFGGLSALEYDAARDVYLALSDDRGRGGPVRYYELRIPLSADGIGGLDVLRAVEIAGPGGAPAPRGAYDPEGLRLAADGALFWASERDAPKGGAPFLSRIAPPPPAAGAGGVGVPAARAEETLRIPAPGYYAPRFEGETRVAGVRENLGFESLTIAPDGRLVAANEGPLVQDAEKPSLAAGAPARVLLLEPDGTPVREHLYPVDPLPARPIPADGFATSGLVEMLSDPAGGGLLALERSFAVGQGHVVKLYRTDFAGAQDVLGRESAADVPPAAQMRKRLLHTIQAGAHVDYVDNIEAITFGPEIAGDRTLVLISDNNFNPRQATQVLAYRLKE